MPRGVIVFHAEGRIPGRRACWNGYKRLPVSSTRTVAVFSYASQRRRIVQTAFEGIFKSTWGLQKYELSKLILGRISNVLISPRHFKAWSQTKRPVARATLRLRPRRQAFAPSTSITRINLWNAASPRPRLKSWGVFAVLTLPIVPAYLCYAQWIFRGETTVGTANGE